MPSYVSARSQSPTTQRVTRFRLIGALVVVGCIGTAALTYTLIYVPALNAYRGMQSPFAACATAAAGCTGPSIQALVYAVLTIVLTMFAAGIAWKLLGQQATRGVLAVGILAGSVMTGFVFFLWSFFGVIGP